jgi:peptidylprolyl isomerase
MSTQTAPTGPGDAARRRQALGGAIAGVAIVVILTIVFIVVKPDHSDKSNKSAAAPASAAAVEPSAAAAEPSAAAPQPSATPVSVKTPPALAKEPAVAKGGKQPLTKLVVTPIVKGAGPKVQKGQTITANYKLVSYKTGEVMDSSWQRGPFQTPIGVGKVIQGWDQAIPGQRVGSRLQLDVPAALAYGEQDGDLRFVVDILAAS